MVHSGVIHFIAEDDKEAILICQKLLSFLPSNNLEDPPRFRAMATCEPDPALNDIVPVDGKQGYDVRDVILRVVDNGDFLEVQSGYAMNIVVGFARILGRSSASSPTSRPPRRAYSTSTHRPRPRASSASATPSTSRWSPSSTCPASCPACSRNTAASSATAPRCCSPTRRRPCPRSPSSCARPTAAPTWRCAARTWAPTACFAWPTAEIAVMGAEGAAEIVFRKEIESAEQPADKRRELIEQVPRSLLQPLCRRRPPPGRRHHRARRHAQGHRPGARIPAHQARTAAGQEARPDPALRERHEQTSDEQVTLKLTELDAARTWRPAAEGGMEQRRVAAHHSGSPPWRRRRASAPAPPPRRKKISEELLMAISAAVAAYLGKRAHIRQVRLIGSTAWAQQGRVSASRRRTADRAIAQQGQVTRRSAVKLKITDRRKDLRSGSRGHRAGAAAAARRLPDAPAAVRVPAGATRRRPAAATAARWPTKTRSAAARSPASWPS